MALTDDGGSFGSFGDLIDFSDSKGMANDATTISFWYNNLLAANANPADIKNSADFDDPADGIQADETTTASATSSSTATGATTADFSWSGYSFPTLTAAAVELK